MSAQVAAPGAARLVPTPYLELVRDTLGEMADAHGLVVLDGAVGTGKTTAIRGAAPELGIPVVYNRLGPRPGIGKVTRNLLGKFEPVSQRLSSDEATRRLQERLAERDRIVVVDEAQKLGRDGIDVLVELHDHADSRFTLVMVGAKVESSLLRFEEFSSRVSRVVRFGRLTGEPLHAFLDAYHPLLAATDLDLLNRLDQRYLKGSLRNWAFFTHAAYNRLPDGATTIDEETAKIALAVMGRVPT